MQRLSPRFYARTRLGDILSAFNNDIGGNPAHRRRDARSRGGWARPVLIGTVVMLAC